VGTFSESSNLIHTKSQVVPNWSWLYCV